jgi:hypothetical protein
MPRGVAPGSFRPRVAAAVIARNWRTLLWATPVVAALVYAIVVLTQFKSIITTIYLDSDTAAAPVLAHLAGGAPAGTQIVLGNHAYYEEFLFLRLTNGLPDFRQLWEVAPMLWSICGLGLLGWAAWRVFGRFPALLAVSALLCVGSFGRLVAFTFDWHGLTIVHTIVIGGVLVWIVPRAASLSWLRVVALAVVLGLIGVLPAASDQLFVFWALVPMVVTGFALAWRGAGPMRARMATFGVVAAVVSLVGGALVAHAMRSGGVTAFPFGYTLVPAASVVNNILLSFESYMYIAGGYFFGLGTSFSAWTVVASGVLALAAWVFVVVEVRRRVARAAPRMTSGDPQVGARFAYVVFWTTCLLVTTAVFLLTSAPVDVNGARYILAGYVAIAALLPLVVTHGLGWRLAVSAGVCVFAISAIYQATTQSFANTALSQANLLARYARQQHVTYGYGGYWDADYLTWTTRFKLQVYPVLECTPTHGLCVFQTVHISSSYIPRPHTRSLLIVDPAQVAPTITALDPAFGRPISTTTIGSLIVYVFPYDIAAKLAG